MFKFTKTGIFVLSIIIVFCLLQIYIHQYSIQTEINQEIMEKSQKDNAPVTESVENVNIWQIEIPKISLNADISEGTTKEILNQYQK